jgi:hyaluronate lyase
MSMDTRRTSVSRSVLVRAILATVVVATLLVVPLAKPDPAAAADSFDSARARWLLQLTGGTDYDPSASPYREAVERITAEARANWTSMATAPFNEPWSDLSTGTRVADLHEAYTRLKEMALAYRTKGSALARDPRLLSSILTGLDWLGANRYNTSTKQDTNTWYWALGIPMELNDTSVLLYAELGSSRISAYAAAQNKFLPRVYTTGAYSTGANRAWSVKVIALRAILTKNDAQAREARDGLPAVLAYTTTGDGFYERGGFIQHTSIPYVGGYGISAIELSAEVMYLFRNSPWVVTDPATSNLYASVRTTFAPFLINGAMMDSVRGREISREYRQDVDAGVATIHAIGLLSASAPASTSRQLQAAFKTLLLSADGDFFRASSSIMELRRSAVILGDATLAPAAGLSGAFAFASMDRFVHRAPDYAFGVSASSSRISNFETANAGENQKAWYTADGLTSLYVDGTAQYSDDYWATVNRYRLPGTTVDTRIKGVNDGRNYRSKQTFAGGLSSTSGANGAYGMVLDAALSNLVANKAWFTFDDEIIALGNGINDAGLSGTGWDGAAMHVETIVDDRRMDAPGQRLLVDGTGILSSSATSFANPAWAQIEGTAGNVGYTFPGGESLRAARTVNTGSWFDINAKNGTKTPRSDTYFALWVDHGRAPANGTYAYVVLPGSSLAHTTSYAASPDTTVLANSTAVSAVKETTKNAVGAVFWRDASATVTVGGQAFLTSSARSVVMTEESASGIAVAVTDPTQARVGTIRVELNRAASATVSLSPGVTVERLRPTIVLKVDVTAAQGREFDASFRY